MSVEFLRRLPLFAELSETDLAVLYQQAEPVTLAAGEWLMHEGERGESLYVVLAGSIEITKRSGEQTVVLACREAGEVIGEMALLDHTPRSASGRAVADSRLLKIDQLAFKQMLRNSPDAAIALLHTASTRLQSTEALLRQSEKMAALGTLAAGLAHELNNPAAAVQRSASQLQTVVSEWQTFTERLGLLTHDSAQSDLVNKLHAELPQRATTLLELDPIACGDRETETQIWLEAQGVDNAWQIAPVLVSLRFDLGMLQHCRTVFPGAGFAILMEWLAAGGSTYVLLDELKIGAGRLSEIVKAVKTYSYLDQAPVQNVDIQAGLESTLIILRHKMRGVEVKRDYATDLPPIEAYGSELNQVWTNIIDNALDALNGQGELQLKTERQADSVVVEISDNGPGVPANLQSRLFEPFFTTKPPGAGTGLGLHIAYNIVARHRGQIKLTSEPGRTTFRVTLPPQLQRG